MLTAKLLFALLFPLVIGAGALSAWWPRAGAPGRLALLLGYGWLGGWLLVAAGLWIWGRLGLPFALVGNSLLPAGLALLAAAVGMRLPRAPAFEAPPARRGEGHWPEILVAGALLLILLRLGLLAAETATMPLFPWDAWMNWAPKSRAWFEAGRLVPFVSEQAWLASDTPVYTIDAWRYPPAVPLIQLWTALWAGRWDDTLIGLPWVTCLAALLLALYGQLRTWGASAAAALVFTYLLASLPLVDINVALAGYADLWLAAIYAAAAMALLQWSRSGDPRQGLLALLFALALVGVKGPGIGWLLTLLLALLPARLPGGAVVAGGAALAAALGWVLGHGVAIGLPGGETLRIGAGVLVIPGIIDSPLAFDPAWRPLLLQALGYDNWHLLWYLLPPALLALPVLAARERWARVALALAATALLLAAFVLFFTNRAMWVEDYTIVNRTLLHMAPSFLFLFALVWHSLGSRAALFRGN